MEINISYHLLFCCFYIVLMLPFLLWNSPLHMWNLNISSFKSSNDIWTLIHLNQVVKSEH